MKRFSWAALAGTLILAGTGMAQAQDTIRLGGTGDATVRSLEFDGQVDTEQVYWRGGGFYRRPYVGVYRPYYRPYAYRPYLAYRPYYGYRPYAFASFYPGYNYGPTYYAPSYYAPGYYGVPAYSYYVNPCATDLPSMPSATVLGSSSYARGPIFQTPSYAASPNLRPLTAPQDQGGTYFYDGGPGQPLPLPSQDAPAPTFQQKRPTVPLDGRLVSIPAQSTKYSYPAYGETTPIPAPAPASFSCADRPTLLPRIWGSLKLASASGAA